MRTLSWLSTRRVAANVAVALLVATVTAAGVAFADSSSSHSPAAKAPASTGTGTRAPDAITTRARAALDRLVANGTINQSQADAIQQDVVAGSVDPAALIAAGTVGQAQMRAVANALDRVKKSVAEPGGGRHAGTKVAAPATGPRAPAVIQRAARTALQGLVASGTITQPQADTIEHDVAAGVVDSHALVAGGTVDQSQMQAVSHALALVKLAAAAAAG
jgi:polyhydroxyalkanoate synthesis regulator phasin